MRWVTLSDYKVQTNTYTHQKYQAQNAQNMIPNNTQNMKQNTDCEMGDTIRLSTSVPAGSPGNGAGKSVETHAEEEDGDDVLVM